MSNQLNTSLLQTLVHLQAHASNDMKEFVQTWNIISAAGAPPVSSKETTPPAWLPNSFCTRGK